MDTAYLKGVTSQFEYYRMLGEKAMAQIDDASLFIQYNKESNSIATIVKHMWGNMLSRWTDPLTTDGEKEWRDREGEFNNDISSREELMHKWNEGWSVLFAALNSFREEDLQKIIYIRNQGHTVMEAINRQLAHYPYHVGQIVFLARMYASEWQSLSIPRGGTAAFNEKKFASAPGREHFTKDLLDQSKEN